MDDQAEAKNAVKTIFRSLMTDYGEQFTKQFLTDHDRGDWMKSLYKRTYGATAKELLEGFESLHVNKKLREHPTVSEIVYAVQDLRSTENSARKHGKLCGETREISEEERKQKKAKAIADHAAVIGSHLARCRKGSNDFHSDPQCFAKGCNKPGTVSKGAGWYCMTHLGSK